MGTPRGADCCFFWVPNSGFALNRRLCNCAPMLTIESMPISELIEDPANLRKHGPRNLETIRGSLQRFGQIEPLVVRRQTGVVIGGNGRLSVMREMGWTHADVVRVDFEDTTATALAIALNRTAELASWDNEALQSVLRTFDDDLMNAAGFELPEVDALVGWDIKPDDPDGIDDYDADKDTFIAKVEGIKSSDRELVERELNSTLGKLGLGLVAKIY